MIDISKESLLTLTEAAGRLPRRRRGKCPDVSTLYRWAQRGLRGIRLECIQVGGTKCTSSQAIQRFFDALGQRRVVQSATRSANEARRSQIDAAEAQLNNEGI